MDNGNGEFRVTNVCSLQPAV